MAELREGCTPSIDLNETSQRAQGAELRSIHTAGFAKILEDLGISIIVSTYQAHKLVLIRSRQGRIDTLFRGFKKPMGIAVDDHRLAVGGALEIWRFQNVPAVAPKLEPLGEVDACFLPRSSHVTGDIQIHEMAWSGSSLWFVNTRFSCLCTLDDVHNFCPRWWPRFITALLPEDRCHLNGLCMVDGTPRFVTALGDGNAPTAWRANKKDGGVLIDIKSGKTVVRGLSMPHSPRWYNDRLWILESGNGGLGYIEPKTWQYKQVRSLPGFTRGLDFYGRFAFVGLSQVRETAIFSGIPITDRETERRSGVWVVDITCGSVVAYLQFEEAVQEVFAVHVFRNFRFPEIINDDNRITGNSFELPDDALAMVPIAEKQPAARNPHARARLIDSCFSHDG